MKKLFLATALLLASSGTVEAATAITSQADWNSNAPVNADQSRTLNTGDWTMNKISDKVDNFGSFIPRDLFINSSTTLSIIGADGPGTSHSSLHTKNLNITSTASGVLKLTGGNARATATIGQTGGAALQVMGGFTNWSTGMLLTGGNSAMGATWQHQHSGGTGLWLYSDVNTYNQHLNRGEITAVGGIGVDRPDNYDTTSHTGGRGLVMRSGDMTNESGASITATGGASGGRIGIGGAGFFFSEGNLFNKGTLIATGANSSVVTMHETVSSPIHLIPDYSYIGQGGAGLHVDNGGILTHNSATQLLASGGNSSKGLAGSGLAVRGGGLVNSAGRLITAQGGNSSAGGAADKSIGGDGIHVSETMDNNTSKLSAYSFDNYGTINATGGSGSAGGGSGGNGMRVSRWYRWQDSMPQSLGRLSNHAGASMNFYGGASAGSGQGGHGLQGENGVMENRGNLRFAGSDTSAGSTGAHGGNTFNYALINNGGGIIFQAGNSSANGTGGHGLSASAGRARYQVGPGYTVDIPLIDGSNAITQLGGNISARGGQGTAAGATGGDGVSLRGLSVSGGSTPTEHNVQNILNSGGDFTAEGGDGSSGGSGGAGVRISGQLATREAYIRNSAGFSATGGDAGASGTGGMGISADRFTMVINQDGGIFTATGGSGAGIAGHGLLLNEAATFTNESGATLNATGGGDSAGTAGNGLTFSSYASSGLFNLSGGVINATGGDSAGNSAGHGLFLDTLSGLDNQDGGVINARGGDSGGGNAGHGVYAANAAVNNGTLLAESGSGAGRGYGLYVSGLGSSFTNNGILQLKPSRDGLSTRSVYVDPQSGLASGLNFGPSSNLDLMGGTFWVNQGNVSIASGASVAGHNIPQVSGLAVGQSFSQDFIEIDPINVGKILGTLQAQDTLTLSYGLEVINEKTYRIIVTRTASVSKPEEPGPQPGPSGGFKARERNTVEMLRGVESALLGQTDPLVENTPWNLIMQDLDSQTNAGRFVSVANRYARYGTPQATTRAFGLMQRQQRAVTGIMSRQLLAGLASAEAEPVYVASAGPVSIPSGGGTRYTGWALPFHQSGRQEAKSRDFTDMDEHFTGVSVGGTAAWDSTVLGFGFHYVSGSMEASGYDATIDTTGLTAGIGRRFRLNELFNPWAEIRLGYSYQSFDQDREDFLGQTHNSTPDAHLLNAGLLLSNDFTSGKLTVTPRIGLDYTHIEMDSYKESNNANYAALSVNPDGHDSLIGNAGVELRWNLNSLVTLEARGNYYYEFIDTDTKLRSRALASPEMNFATYAQDDDGHMGNLGLGVQLAPDKNLSIGLNYDLHLADHYTGHKVEAGLKFKF